MNLMDWCESDELPWSALRWKQRSLERISQVVVHQAAGAYLGGSNRDVKGINAYMISPGNHITPGIPLPHIPYHFMIDDDGTVYKCNHMSAVTWHCKDGNAVSVGVCLIGDFDATSLDDKPHIGVDHDPTAEQLTALGELLPSIFVQVCPGKRLAVVGHKEIQAFKPFCPGDKIMDWLCEWRRNR